VSRKYGWRDIHGITSNVVEDRSERLAIWLDDHVTLRMRGGDDAGIYVHRELSRALQPTVYFDDYLAHWDNDLVRSYAAHAQQVVRVHRANQMDRELVEIVAPLVPVWHLRRDVKRWVTAYTEAHPDSDDETGPSQ
jgi:hypothetical protein